MVNRIQNLRKDSGFEVTDRINVEIKKEQQIDKAVKANLEYIKAETLTNNIDLVENVNNGTEVVFDEVETTLGISKN